MDDESADPIEKCSVELNIYQVAHLNKLLPNTVFRFISEKEIRKRLPNAKAIKNKRLGLTTTGKSRAPRSRGRRSSISSSKGSVDMSSVSGKERFSSASNRQSNKVSSSRAQSQNKASVKLPSTSATESKSLSGPQQMCVQFINKLRNAVKRDFPNLLREFDLDSLEDSVKKGVYTDLKEFKATVTQIIKAVQRRHPEHDFTYLGNPGQPKKKENTKEQQQEAPRPQANQGESKKAETPEIQNKAPEPSPSQSYSIQPAPPAQAPSQQPQQPTPTQRDYSFYLSKEGKKELASKVRKLPGEQLKKMVKIIQSDDSVSKDKSSLQFDMNKLADKTVIEMVKFIKSCQPNSK